MGIRVYECVLVSWLVTPGDSAFKKSETNSFSQQRDPEAFPREGPIVRHFPTMLPYGEQKDQPRAPCQS